MAFERVEPARPLRAIGREPGVDLRERRGVDLVHAALCFLARAHEAGVTQYPQVARHAGLADAERVDQLADGTRALEQEIEDAAPGGLGEDRKSTRLNSS